jgi:phage shock protein E
MSNTLMSLEELYQVHTHLGVKDVILDVRRADEFAQGHIPAALNIPIDQVIQHLEKLKQYEHIYIHCKLGGRAKMAFEALSQAGLKNLVCISDAGMDLWMKNGYPAEK